jgi:hypothetical protein
MMSECGVFDKLKELACSVSTGSANGEYQIMIWKACCGIGGECRKTVQLNGLQYVTDRNTVILSQ